ncbi:MAG: DUF4270 domain-containing protein [Lentimicrobiaceae bacterium]|nr:DUF4270 domain-containing protein [Lentimicrobiaceae bacterium]
MIVATFAGFQSCQKDISSIGLNLKDRDDLINAIFTDSISINAYSILEDTLNTKNLISNYLGFIKDPVFGTTTAGIYTQFIPQGSSVSLGEFPQLDSIVLTLRYSGGFFGDTLNPFSIKVYRITEDISSTKPYYQNNVFAHSDENLTYKSDFILFPKPTSNVMLDTFVVAHARIKLSDELGNLFLRNVSQMASNESFKSFFKGLYICAIPLANNGSLVNFNLTSEISGIQLYYKNDTIKRQLSFPVRSTETVRISTYQHEYKQGSAEFVNQVLQKDTTLGKDILYLQSMGGVKTKISFPNIKEFKDKNVVINKAELVITNIGEDLNLFPPPNRLNIQGIDKKGEITAIPDYNTSFWGGNYDETNKEYRFRITRYIQSILLRDEYQPYLYLVTDRAAADANRLLLNGTNPTNNSSSRLRLEIYYTEY